MSSCPWQKGSSMLLLGGEKKGLWWTRPRVATARRSSPSPVIRVFLAPLLSKVLHPTKANSSKKLSGKAPRRTRNDGWGTTGRTADRLDNDLPEAFHIEIIARHKSNRKRSCRMVAPLAGTVSAGRGSDSLPGCPGSVDWRFLADITLGTFSPWASQTAAGSAQAYSAPSFVGAVDTRSF